MAKHRKPRPARGGSVATDLGLLIVRLGTGLILATQGYTKLFGGEGKAAPELLGRVLGKNFREAMPNGGPARFAVALERIGIPFPRPSAWLAGFSETFAGLALAAGLLTRLASPLVLVSMGVAIFRVHWANGAHGPTGYGFAGAIFSGALAVLVAGPGRFSLDRLLGVDGRK
jgi:putative oxidoreductase